MSQTKGPLVSFPCEMFCQGDPQMSCRSFFFCCFFQILFTHRQTVDRKAADSCGSAVNTEMCTQTAHRARTNAGSLPCDHDVCILCCCLLVYVLCFMNVNTFLHQFGLRIVHLSSLLKQEVKQVQMVMKQSLLHAPQPASLVPSHMSK